MSEKSGRISEAEVKHIADLARIGLSEEEVVQFAEEMSDILGYVEKLGEVNTEGVEPVAQVTGMVNVLREDEARDFGDEGRQIIVENFPDRQDGSIRVRQIL